MINNKLQAQHHQTEYGQTPEMAIAPLPLKRIERIDSWGRATSSAGFLYQPTTVSEIKDIFKLARNTNRSIALRGAGNSYGDASLNSENIIVDLREMNRILSWSPESGQVHVEPGVTIAKLWEHVIRDGWWPTVVPGTAKPTIGGCTGMNVHGKNAWKVGTIGDNIQEFNILLPNGRTLTCSREENQDLFFSAIGGIGMLGTITSLKVNLKRIHSGLLDVHALASRSLEEMFQQFDEYLPRSDYLVGWIDGFAKGASLGRGQIHRANYLSPGQDPSPNQTLQPDFQHLPDRMFRVIPRSLMWRMMRPLLNDYGTKAVNLGKYLTSRLTHDSQFRQSHVAFHFLLDYIPDWKLSYGRGGLVQYQCFIPKDNALLAFKEILERCHKRDLVNYLSVLKRHRPDSFLISHGVDGYSLAMDFKVTPNRRGRLQALAAELDEIVLEAGGRFYLAKDSTLHPETIKAFLGSDTVEKFIELKKLYDPEMLLQTNMWRRLFDPYYIES